MADEEVFEIGVVGGDGEPALLTVSEEGALCRLTVEHVDVRLDAEAEDVFEALCMVRRRLEARGMLLRCYGASLNVHPSPMSMSMGGGRMAHRMTMGCPARQSDLVDIFDAGPDIVPATVDDQRRFHDGWSKSIVTTR